MEEHAFRGCFDFSAVGGLRCSGRRTLVLAALVTSCSSPHQHVTADSLSSDAVSSSARINQTDVAATTPTNSVSASDLSVESVYLEFALGPTDEQFDAFEAGRVAWVNDCLGQQGFSAIAQPRSSEERRADGEARLRRLEFNDLELIRKYGYNVGFAVTGAPESRSVPESIPTSVGNALETCNLPVQERARAIWIDNNGVPTDAESLLLMEDGDLSARVNASEELRNVRTLWRQCLSQAGYNPDDRNDRSISRALADSACQTSSGFSSTRLRLLQEGVSSWIADHPGLVAAIVEYNAKYGDLGVRLLAEAKR